MQPLSAVIVTRNDADRIERTIQSMLQVAEEVVIVDAFSTDGTEDICKKYPVRFLSLEWSGFGPQSNYGIDNAIHDAIIQPRAGDVLTEKAIEKIKEQQQYGINGIYALKVVSLFFGKFLRHGTEGPQYRYMIFDRVEVKWHDSDNHDLFYISKKTERHRLRGEVMRYAYPTMEEYIQKTNAATSLEAEKAFRRGKKKYASKIIFSPSFYFIKDFFLNFGFLEGMHGFIVAKLVAQRNFLKYSKLRELRQRAADPKASM
jgi:(heptosyl)LPS beta-1,4-glucosyltransferase